MTKKPRLAPIQFQNQQGGQIPTGSGRVARIKRNIHRTIKNFSSCKTCMISMKRFQQVEDWHFRCLKAARTREKEFPEAEPDQLYEENRSDN
jgi:hypothetical protein